jgi:putative ABC transport system substrate-binding protein
MRRREFLGALGSAAALPMTVRAQQPAMPVIGFLSGASAWEYAYVVAALRRGLKEAGYTEGQNLVVEYRWAEAHYERLPMLATELVARGVKVIAANGLRR